MKKIVIPPVKKEQSLYNAVSNVAKKVPNRIAFRYFFKAFKYKHLLKRINQFAYMLKKMGVKEDSIVTICLPNIPEALYLLYAVNQLGAVANIVHPLFTYEQMDEALTEMKCNLLFVLDINYKTFKPLEDKGVTVVVCQPTKELPLVKKLVYKKKNKDKLLKPTLNTDAFYKCPRYVECDDSYLKDSILLHSGGTSGKSKIIALSNFAINSVSFNTYWIIDHNDVNKWGILSVLPMFHGFGLCKGIHSFLAHGGTDVLMPKFSRKDAVRYIAKNQMHILLGVPVLYEALLSKRNFRGRKLKHLYIAFVGGDYVSPALLERFNIRMEKAHSVCRLKEGYGLTEVVNVCSVNTHSHYKPGTVGELLPTVKGIVIDEKGNVLKPNEDGEICIGGESIMNGYRYSDDKDINSRVFYIDKDGEKYIRTGDFGSIDEERYVSYKTRMKRIVKVNGVPVFPSMIEDCATSFNFVYETCAIGVDDVRHGHIIKLYIMLSKTYKGSAEEARKKVEERIISRLGIYSKPKEIIFIDKMPHTALGKIDYKKLQ